MRQFLVVFAEYDNDTFLDNPVLFNLIKNAEQLSEQLRQNALGNESVPLPTRLFIGMMSPIGTNASFMVAGTVPKGDYDKVISFCDSGTKLPFLTLTVKSDETVAHGELERTISF